jgi:hypothetical protein
MVSFWFSFLRLIENRISISLEILTIMIESEGWMKPAEDEKGTVFDC